MTLTVLPTCGIITVDLVFPRVYVLDHASYPGNEEARTTAIHVAAFCGDKSVVGLLIQSGANPEIKNAKGQTLMEAAPREGRRKILDGLRNSRSETF